MILPGRRQTESYSEMGSEKFGNSGPVERAKDILKPIIRAFLPPALDLVAQLRTHFAHFAEYVRSDGPTWTTVLPEGPLRRRDYRPSDRY